METPAALKPFLTACWRRLILAQYETDPAILAPHIPAGLTLDTWQGRPFVSVVAFEFMGTRVRGLRVPGCENFAEVNLRLYVTDGERRGVCFVRELVPSRLTALVARVVYNEPYARARMHAATRLWPGSFAIEHRFRFGGADHRIHAAVDADARTPPEGSLEHHFKEHEWGFGRTRRGEPTVYRVVHPVWRTHRVREASVQIDAARLYGERWGWLTGREPDSVVVAEGSEVAVYPYARRPSPLSRP